MATDSAARPNSNIVSWVHQAAYFFVALGGTLSVFLINLHVRRDYFAGGGFVYFDSVSYIYQANESFKRIESGGLLPWMADRFSQVGPFPEMFSAVLFRSSLDTAYPFLPYTLFSIALFAGALVFRLRDSTVRHSALLVTLGLLLASPFAWAVYGGTSDTWLESPTIWLIGGAYLLLVSAIQSQNWRASLASGGMLALAALSRETAVVLTAPFFIACYVAGLACVCATSSLGDIRSRIIRQVWVGVMFALPMLLALAVAAMFQYEAIVYRAARNVGVDLFTDRARLASYILHPRILQTHIATAVAAFAVIAVIALTFKRKPRLATATLQANPVNRQQGNGINALRDVFPALSLVLGCAAFNASVYGLSIAYHSINLFNYLFLLFAVVEMFLVAARGWKVLAIGGALILVPLQAAAAVGYFATENTALRQGMEERRDMYDMVLEVAKRTSPKVVALYFESGGVQFSVFTRHITHTPFEAKLALDLKQHGRVLRVGSPELDTDGFVQRYLDQLQEPGTLLFTYCSGDDVAASIQSGLWTPADRDVPEAILVALSKLAQEPGWKKVFEFPQIRRSEIGGTVCAFLFDPDGTRSVTEISVEEVTAGKYTRVKPGTEYFSWDAFGGSSVQRGLPVQIHLASGYAFALLSSTAVQAGDLVSAELRLSGEKDTELTLILQRHCDSQNGEDAVSRTILLNGAEQTEAIEHTFLASYSCLRITFVSPGDRPATIKVHSLEAVKSSGLNVE